MKINWYNIALKLLRVVMYAKRLLFWILNFIWALILALNELYSRTLGFYLYRSIERVKKLFQKFSFTKQQGALDIFGRRGFLQLIFLFIGIAILFPHSRLYTRSFDEVAGRKTIMYTLVGPGSQAYDLQETVSDVGTILSEPTNSWKQAAVYSGDRSISSIQNGYGSTDIAGVARGGSALTKPMIMPGVNVQTLGDTTVEEAPSTNRTSIVLYEVQPGDVLGGISEKFGISINTILSANNLNARSYIRPGQKLTILPVDGVVHTVARGDTILRVAQTYGAKSENIVAFNELEQNGVSIKIGQQLIVPGGVRPQPKPVSQPQGIASKPTSFDRVTAPPPSLEVPAGIGYIWPSAAKIITQYYGLRHNGLDIAGPVGTALYATKAGTVIISQCGYNGGYGCYIKLDHGGGVTSIYGHASQLLVSKGDSVAQGETIALMGSTGNSTGPHVHFEIRVNGKNQNPLSYTRK